MIRPDINPNDKVVETVTRTFMGNRVSGIPIEDIIAANDHRILDFQRSVGDCESSENGLSTCLRSAILRGIRPFRCYQCSVILDDQKRRGNVSPKNLENSI